MNKTCEKCIHYEVCRYPLEYRAFPNTCWKYEEERPHGEWIPFEWDDNYSTKIPLPKGSDSHMEEYWDEEFMCSVCGKEHHARNFCPNCGADMSANDRQVTGKLNSEIENSKSEIVPDYRDGWRMRGEAE